MIEKKAIFHKLTQLLEEQLERTYQERSRLDSNSAGTNATIMTQAYDKQEKTLLQSLADLNTISSAQHRDNTVTEGSLLQVEIKELNKNKYQLQWWLILSCLNGKIASVNINDQIIYITGAYQYSDTLIGKTQNQVIQYPPIHGDNRDWIETIKIIEIH